MYVLYIGLEWIFSAIVTVVFAPFAVLVGRTLVRSAAPAWGHLLIFFSFGLVLPLVISGFLLGLSGAPAPTTWMLMCLCGVAVALGWLFAYGRVAWWDRQATGRAVAVCEDSDLGEGDEENPARSG